MATSRFFFLSINTTEIVNSSLMEAGARRYYDSKYKYIILKEDFL